jgi:hypothetical protein
MAAPKEVIDLVERYYRNRDDYQKSSYNETNTRREFLDPLFKALGWDIDNTAGNAEAYKDVVHEDAIKVAGATKAPDYSFRVGGTRKFFLEAKKPSINILDSAEPAFQLRRYAWSAKLPLSILSNFEELAVYDCRIRPFADDRAATARIKVFRAEEYEQRWGELEDIFAKDAIYKGSFDKYADTTRTKKGTAEVDDEFLAEIEEWRTSLARNIALRNPSLSQRELNYSLQQIIDRIIFLRICEDRGIEPYGRLKALIDGDKTYSRLVALFEQADDRYNSGLFHFKDERDRKTPPDSLTPSLHIDDKTLKNIFRRLYYPESPYEFSVLPADILGQVYEQFLGKLVRLTATGQAKVEDKPEARREGGVYYTPTYIVEYVVRTTVEDTLARKTLKTVKGLTVLDPACGSGSFLIAAYQAFLTWYLAHYSNEQQDAHARGRQPRIFRNSKGAWRLTTHERKRILLEHVFGVDIDPQAVEVTKLSLLLKVLEDESQETLGKSREMFQERALPDLDDNIKCGNSLIGPEIYAGRFDFDDEEKYRINAFDWSAEFSQIPDKGGFDIIIGNPPYRRELDYKELMDEVAATSFGMRYRVARMDLWYYFVHRSLELLKENGRLSFIVNAYWMAGTGAEKLIAALQSDTHVEELFHLGKLHVFRNVSGQHIMFRLTKAEGTKSTLVKLVAANASGSAHPYVTGKMPIQQFEKSPAQLFRAGKIDIQPLAGDLLAKISVGTPLAELGIIRQGIAENPAAINRKTNERFDGHWPVGQGVFVLTAEEVLQLQVPASEQGILRPYHELKDIGRYFIRTRPSAQIIYSTKTTWPSVNAFPVLRDHLKRFRAVMEERRETKEGKIGWWHLHWPRDEGLWRAPKILSIQMGRRPSFVPAIKPVYVSFSVNVFVPNDASRENIFFTTAILNSRLLWKWFRHHAKQRGSGLEINGHVLQKAPIYNINARLPSEVDLQKQLATLAEQMVDLRRRHLASRTEHERKTLERQIASVEVEIDQLVYELYGLTKDEIESIDKELS